MMTSDSSCQVPDYSSSRPMVISERCKASLELGKKLTKELGFDQSVDTLGRWMAHYVAGLIQEAENVCNKEQPAKMRACYDAILELWKHRHVLPDGKCPFEEFKPILRTLESLDPEDCTPKYYHSVRSIADDTEENDETKSWLKLIKNIDYSAKVLIRYCLTQAAQNALDKSAEWVSLAEAAGADEGIEFTLIRIITEEESMIKKSDSDEKNRKRIENRIVQLEEYATIIMETASDLRQKVNNNQRPE